MSIVKPGPTVMNTDLLESSQTMTMKNGETRPYSVSDPNNRSVAVINTPLKINNDASPMVSTAKVNMQLNKRVDLESLIEQYTNILGRESWARYAQIITLFMLGKLSRKELSNEIDLLFVPPNVPNTTPALHKNVRKTLIRLHNQIMLSVLSNALRDSPLGVNAEGSWGFGKSGSQMSKKRVNKHNSQIETYKKIVMSLPPIDRQRLRAITKESGKRGFVLCSVLQARLDTIPKIPIVTNQESVKFVKENNFKTPTEWSQDVMNGFSAPLAIDTHSLPDTDSLYLRMLGISREHGLVGAVDANSVDILSLALDQYLKNVIESVIDTVKYSKKNTTEFYDLDETSRYQPIAPLGPSEQLEDQNEGQTISLTNEDMYTAFNVYPYLVQSESTKLTVSSLDLLNDDELVITKSSIDDLVDFLDEKPSFTPTDENNIGSREELNWLIKDILTDR
ncbi:hypothetical protein TPHA_0H02070 [Tetrapisispora phaffii CBS 4417]|uniref:Transcriptional coactivator HFI1/ADA1 n=1 Tax=Tetrapisispora phaffii (strain ATCC 24235 / CBS 4417 / NBRC 1672 / NRRL Y-8282 / UCD 70-5) TaxID=1071381 RepID=G8BWG0_TETPH|nr:hypothetical protein TPHA_0H02070 [Tetrapisispora phaffii CBS 4417]CCE64411.1 hypothetical protein TPHA_0H02070 [Tetrapisispora phaffii CBS 4417]